MALTAALLFGAMLFAAPGDIYRCKNAAGAVSFQDKPCSGGSSAKLATKVEDSGKSMASLQRWLDQQGPSTSSAPSYTRANNAPLPSRVRGSASAVNEAQLAGCSERFLYCANGNAAAMDACVSNLRRCAGSAGGACCPQQCITRYQDFRGQGQGMASSVRLALLDPTSPNCAIR